MSEITSLGTVIRITVEAEANTNFMTDAERDKLASITNGNNSTSARVTNVVAVGGASSIGLTWDAITDPAYPVQFYAAFYREKDSPAWLRYSENATEPSLQITGLRNGIMHEAIIVPFTSHGFGLESDVASATPTGKIQPLYKLLDGVCALWDTRMYDGTNTKFINSCPVPADGAVRSDYDVWLGTDGTTTQDPTWNISRFTLDNDNFTLVAGANPPLIETMHKGSFGVEWTFFGKFKTGNSLAASVLFATCYQDTQRGIVIRHDSSGNVKVDQYNGTSKTTVEFDQKVVAGTYYYFAVAYDFSTDRLYFSLNGSDFELKEARFATLTGAASNTLRLCSDANNASRFAAGSEVLGFGLIDRRLKAPELAVLNSWLANYFDPPAYTVPDAPYALIVAPADGGVYASVSTPESYGGTPARTFGGTPITDYVWEYKLNTEPTTWTPFAHTASPVPRILITGLTNGLLYNFRVKAINAMGTGAASETANCTPAALPVAGPFSLASYKISFPDNAAGYRTNQLGFAREVTQPTFGVNGFGGQCSYFYTTASYYAYIACDGGATTSNNAYACRSELRQEENKAHNFSDSNTVKFSVERLANDHKTIVHQIHRLGGEVVSPGKTANGDPTFKMQVLRSKTGTGINVYALVKVLDKGLNPGAVITVNNSAGSPVTYTSGTDIRVPYSGYLYSGNMGDIIESRVVYTYNPSSTPTNPLSTLEFYINDVLVATQRIHMESSWYWKSGNYYQNAEKVGNICEVRHYNPA